jgi:hypothetical protein
MKGIPKIPKTEEAWLKEGAGREAEFKTTANKRKKRLKKDMEPVLTRIPRELFNRMKELINASGTETPLSHWIVEAIKRRVENDEKSNSQ